MKHTVLGSVLLASLLVLAGCTAGLPLGSDGQSATTVIYLSDAPIDEFEYLNVTVSKVGISDREFDLEVEQEIEFEEGLGADAPVVEAAYEFEYDPAQWTESDVDVTVDLTQLQGDRATRIAALDLPSGDYGAVYVEVSRIEGVLKTGERVTFVQPEGKILLSTGFTVEAGETTEFVFDLGVAKTEAGYVLLPDASHSGVNIPFVAVEQESENLHLEFIGDVDRGQQATIEVSDNRGNPVEGAIVEVNGDEVGTTDADGRITFTVPAGEDSLEVSAEHELGEARIEFDFSDATPEPTETTEA